MDRTAETQANNNLTSSATYTILLIKYVIFSSAETETQPALGERFWERSRNKECFETAVVNGGAGMKTKVKICGLTKPTEAQMLNKYGADYAGFVMFYEKSRRNNTVQNAWQVLRYLDRKIQRVAVVVSPTLEQIRMIEQMDFQAVQIHGELPEELLEKIRLPIWRAYNIKDRVVPEESDSSKISAYVLDGGVPGSGKAFDWEALKRFQRGDKMLVLAGGLHEDNVKKAIDILHPDVVDVSSGVEGENGKDAQKVREFIRRVRE